MARLADVNKGQMTPDEAEALANDTFDYADRERVTLRAANLKIRNDAIDKNRRTQFREINKVFGTNFDTTNPNAETYNITKGYGDFTFGEKVAEAAKAVQRGAGSIVKLPGVALKAIGELEPDRAEIARRGDKLNNRGAAYFNSPVGKAEKATMDMLREAGNSYIRQADSMMLRESPESIGVRQQPFGAHPFYRTTMAVAESSPSYGLAVASTLSTGNPNIGLFILGSTTASSSYDSFRAQGVDPDLALIGALAEGSIEMLTEKVPMDLLMKGAGKPLLIRALRVGSAESFQELFAQLGQNYVNAVVKDIDPENLSTAIKAARQEWSVISEGWQDAMAAGLVMGGGAAAIAGDVPDLGRSPEEMLAEYGFNPRNPQEFIALTEKIKQNVKQVELFEDVIEEAAKAGDTGVTLDLAELEAIELSKNEIRRKVIAGEPLESAEREQFPELAKQEDQIAQLQATGLAGIPQAPVAEEILPEQEEGPIEVVSFDKKIDRKAKDRIRQDIENDPVFEIESEAQDVRKREIDVGVYFVPENLRGEVNKAIENDPSLRFNVTFTRSPGVPEFSEAVQEGFLQRAGDVTDTILDISEFLDRVSEAKKSRKKIGGVSEVVIDKMIASPDPFSQINAVRHQMASEGFTASEINEAVQDIADEFDIDSEPHLLRKVEDVGKGAGIPKDVSEEAKPTTAEPEASAADRIQQIQDQIQSEITAAEEQVKAGRIVEPPTREIGEGEEIVRGSALSTIALAVESDLLTEQEALNLDLPTYKPMNMKEMSERLTSMIAQDVEKVKRIAFYQEAAPPDVYPEKAFSALKTWAAHTGDVDLIMDIAMNEDAQQVHTVMGKRIKSLDTQTTTDPVDAVQEVIAARVEKKIRDGEDTTALEEENARLKVELDTTKKALDNHIEKTKQEYGSKNKGVKRTEYDAILDRRRAEAAKLKHDPRLGAVFVPGVQDFIDIAKIGAFHLEAIGRDFAKWSYQMQQDFGEWINPLLADEYDKATTQADTAEIDSALDKLKKRLQKQIASLEKQIETREIATKKKGVQPSDAEVVVLRERIKVLKTEFAEVFEEEITDKKIAAAIKRTQKSIAELGRKIKAGDISTKTRKKLSSPELNRLRTEQDELRKELQGMRDIAKPKKKPKTRLEKKKTRLIKGTEKIEKQFDERDFEKKPFVPIELDAEGQRLQNAYDIAKEKYKAAQDAAGIITEEEVAIIAQLAKDVAERQVVMDNSTRRNNAEGEGPTTEEYEYGVAWSIFRDFVDSLRTRANTRSIKQIIVDYLKHPQDVIIDFAGLMKATKASLDNSFHFRQGLPTFLKGLTGDIASAKIWGKTFWKSWRFMWDGLKGSKGSERAITATIVSDPDFKQLKDMKLALFVTEEDIPVRIQEKIPFIGRLFRASDVAFELSGRYMRYQLAKQYLKVWRRGGRIFQKGGVKLTKKELESIGSLANSQTGRGATLFKNQEPGFVNNLFWSPRNLRANVDMLTLHILDRKATGFAKRQAAINLLRYISGTAFLLAMANWLDDDSVTFEETSSDFGKIKAAGIRYSIGGSMAVMVVLAARLIEGEFTSATTGKTIPLSPGSPFHSGEASVFNFFKNKLSPAASMALQILDRQTRDGDPITVPWVLDASFTPLIIDSTFEAAEIAGAADTLSAVIAEAVGVNVQVFTDKKTLKTKKRRRF